MRERRYVPGEAGVFALPKPSRSPVRDGPLGIDSDSFGDAASSTSSDLSEEEMEAEKVEATLALARAQADAMLENDMPVRAHAPAKITQLIEGKGRYIRRGEVLMWSDLSFAGECPPPIDSDLLLELVA